MAHKFVLGTIDADGVFVLAVGVLEEPRARAALSLYQNCCGLAGETLVKQWAGAGLAGQVALPADPLTGTLYNLLHESVFRSAAKTVLLLLHSRGTVLARLVATSLAGVVRSPPALVLIS